MSKVTSIKERQLQRSLSRQSASYLARARLLQVGYDRSFLLVHSLLANMIPKRHAGILRNSSLHGKTGYEHKHVQLAADQHVHKTNVHCKIFANHFWAFSRGLCWSVVCSLFCTFGTMEWYAGQWAPRYSPWNVHTPFSCGSKSRGDAYYSLDSWPQQGRSPRDWDLWGSAGLLLPHGEQDHFSMWMSIRAPNALCRRASSVNLLLVLSAALRLRRCCEMHIASIVNHDDMKCAELFLKPLRTLQASAVNRLLMMQADSTLSRLNVLREKIDDTEALVSFHLDSRRNDLVAFDLVGIPSELFAQCRMLL